MQPKSKIESKEPVVYPKVQNVIEGRFKKNYDLSLDVFLAVTEKKLRQFVEVNKSQTSEDEILEKGIHYDLDAEGNYLVKSATGEWVDANDFYCKA